MNDLKKLQNWNFIVNNKQRWKYLYIIERYITSQILPGSFFQHHRVCLKEIPVIIYSGLCISSKFIKDLRRISGTYETKGLFQAHVIIFSKHSHKNRSILKYFYQEKSICSTLKLYNCSSISRFMRSVTWKTRFNHAYIVLIVFKGMTLFYS
jgi:hypothetical protein